MSTSWPSLIAAELRWRNKCAVEQAQQSRTITLKRVTFWWFLAVSLAHMYLSIQLSHVNSLKTYASFPTPKPELLLFQTLDKTGLSTGIPVMDVERLLPLERKTWSSITHHCCQINLIWSLYRFNLDNVLFFRLHHLLLLEYLFLLLEKFILFQMLSFLHFHS